MKKKKEKKRSKLLKLFYPASVLAVTLACIYVLVPGFRELASIRGQVGALERAYQEKSAANESLKKEHNAGDLTEDEEKKAHERIQELTDRFVKEIDETLSGKDSLPHGS